MKKVFNFLFKTNVGIFISAAIPMVLLTVIYKICLCDWALYSLAGYVVLLMVAILLGFIVGMTNTVKSGVEERRRKKK